jgi:integrase
LLGAGLGLRPSETLGLAYSGFDFNRGTVRITRNAQYVRTENGTVLFWGEPKSQRGRRTFKVPPLILERLRRLRLERMQAFMAMGRAWDEDAVICDRGDGQPYDGNAFRRAFKRFAASAGLPREVRMYDLRHTWATSMFDNDVHALIVSSVLGHSSVSFTLQTYTHLREDRTQDAADVVERLLGGTVGT